MTTMPVTDAYQDVVRRTFAQLKEIAHPDQLRENRIPLAPPVRGFLVPVCELHATDAAMIALLAQWRKMNAWVYPTQFDERNRYLRGFAHWIGFKHCPVVYDRLPRTAGKSKAPAIYMLNLAVNAITCFSIKPLQLFSLTGTVTLVGTFCLVIVYFGGWLFSYALPGLTTLYLLAMANLAVMLLGFGAIGEYVGRIYIETKRRPLFVIERTINMHEASLSAAGYPSGEPRPQRKAA